MKPGFSIPCSALALLFLQACGGEAAAAPSNPTAAPPAPESQARPSPAAPAAPERTAPSPAAETATPDAPQNPAKKPMAPVRVNYDLAKILFGNEPATPAVDNPSTPEKVALGKALFHEKGLSKDGSVSCASCHDLANYGQDGKATSPGAGGAHGERNTPTVWNAFRQYKQFWDARADTIEDQALAHVMEPEANGIADEAELVKKIKEKADLVTGFQKAFPGDADAVSAKNFKLAMGAFERTLVTKSRFDNYLDGDQKALSNEEKLGLKTFMDVGCTQCHMSRLVGGNMLQKLGLLKPHGTKDTGRERVTKSDADKFFFKVSPLLNVEKTAPYQHDGKLATLEEAITNMASVQLDKTLKPEETAAIVAFLKALTGPPPEQK
ncbi:MAG TPA: cytochrome c peroxidase [Planctomycetota bacterium]|nr:cytochrome c peroxidase [Planctomycetota bacterium]